MDFEALLDFLERSRGIDFTAYRRTSLERRFRRRLEIAGCPGFAEYVDLLEQQPGEYELLLDTLLVNVTEFFRDPTAWDALRLQALPPILEGKGTDEPIRVWSAGCSSGQEAYTVAMVLAGLLGEEEYRRRVEIHATDIDEAALEQARQGAYTPAETESVPAELRARWFERAGSRLVVREDLRRNVVFGRHDLVADAPIQRLDLLVCRNTLMYFAAEAQSRIAGRFHVALADHGVLMLGRSETLVSRRLFEGLDGRQRLFAKTSRAPARQAGAAGDEERAARDAAMELGPHPQVIVSRAGLLTFANLPARTLFGISLRNLGRPFAELELSSRPVELGRPVETALRERRRVAVGQVTHRPGQGAGRRLDVAVVPLLGGTGPALGASVLFEDVTRLSALEHDVEAGRHELEQAYADLRSTVEALETTNEELRSANEELQTSIEELQSTNEALESSNDDAGDFFEAILTSLGLAVVVVDADGRVRVWNDGAEDLWGLRREEVSDTSILALDIGLPAERLAPALHSVVGGASDGERLSLAAINRRGRPIEVAATVLPLRGDDASAPRGAIVLMEERDPGT